LGSPRPALLLGRDSQVLAGVELVVVDRCEHGFARGAQHRDGEAASDVVTVVGVRVMDHDAAGFPDGLPCPYHPGWLALNFEEHFVFQHQAECRPAGMAVRRGRRGCPAGSPRQRSWRANTWTSPERCCCACWGCDHRAPAQHVCQPRPCCAAHDGCAAICTALALVFHVRRHPCGFVPRSVVTPPGVLPGATAGLTLFAGYSRCRAPLLSYWPDITGVCGRCGYCGRVLCWVVSCASVSRMLMTALTAGRAVAPARVTASMRRAMRIPLSGLRVISLAVST